MSSQEKSIVNQFSGNIQGKVSFGTVTIGGKVVSPPVVIDNNKKK